MKTLITTSLLALSLTACSQNAIMQTENNQTMTAQYSQNVERVFSQELLMLGYEGDARELISDVNCSVINSECTVYSDAVDMRVLIKNGLIASNTREFFVQCDTDDTCENNYPLIEVASVLGLEFENE